MEIIGPIILCAIASLSTLIGYLFALFKVKNENMYICLSLSFAGSIMVLISLKELLPISVKYIILNNNIYNSISILLSIPIFIYFIISLLNKNINYGNSLYRVGVVSMLALVFHNTLEGIITFASSFINIRLGIKLTIAIMIHNIVEGLIVSILIYYSTKSRRSAFIYTFICAISELFGALLIYLLFKSYINAYILNILLYTVGSLMIIIAFKELFIEALKYNNKLYILVGILLSLIILIM